MDSLQVPTKRNPIKIQPMDASFIVVSDDDDEGGLGYQNTLVNNIFFSLLISDSLHSVR